MASSSAQPDSRTKQARARASIAQAMTRPARRNWGALKRFYWEWTGGEFWTHVGEWIRAQKIDLQRALIEEDLFKYRSWTDIPVKLPRASTLLADSPHVRFLEQYQAQGEKVFLWEDFRESHYYHWGRQRIRVDGHYFGQQTDDGILAQARAFAMLYERIRNGDAVEVVFPSTKGHSSFVSLPSVQQTLTDGTVRIVRGHHRLAIAWVLGQRSARVPVLPPVPSELQSLALSVAQNRAPRQLCQPIDRVEFDQSWTVRQPCEDYLTRMLEFLRQRGVSGNGLSVANLGCIYGWFVAALAAQGCDVIGVDPDPAALKVGRLAYNLPVEPLVQSDLPSFLSQCQRTFDVVLLTGGWHDLAQRGDSHSLPKILKLVDAITGRYLFVDIGPTYESWWRQAFPGWDPEALVNFLKQQTSFVEVASLDNGANSNGSHGPQVKGTLLACARDRQGLAAS